MQSSHLTCCSNDDIPVSVIVALTIPLCFESQAASTLAMLQQKTKSVACQTQLSYELLDALDTTFEAVMTGPDTNPATMASALSAYQSTLNVASSAVFGPVNTTITQLTNVIVSQSWAEHVVLHGNCVLSLSCLQADIAVRVQHDKASLC